MQYARNSQKVNKHNDFWRLLSPSLTACTSAGEKRALYGRAVDHLLMTDLSIAEMDFQPVPASERHRPGRVQSVPARLYIDQWQEEHA